MDDERGRRTMELTRDNRQKQIYNQPLIGVAKAGRDTAVKAKGCADGEWGFLPPRGPWWRRNSWRQQQGGSRPQTTVAAAVRHNQLKVMEASMVLTTVEAAASNSGQWQLAVRCQWPRQFSSHLLPPCCCHWLAVAGGWRRQQPGSEGE